MVWWQLGTRVLAHALGLHAPACRRRYCTRPVEDVSPAT